MKQYRFYLEDIDDNTKYELKHDCGGWADYGVNYGRETRISNVVKSYTDGWDFYKEDADWIKQRFYAYGPNRRLRLVVEHLNNALKGEYEVAYRGYLDLTQIEIGMSNVNLPTMESGFFKTLENKWSEEYEIDYDTYCKINGNVFSETAVFETTNSSTDQMPPNYQSNNIFFSFGGNIRNDDDVANGIFQSTDVQMVVPGASRMSPSSLIYQPTILGSGMAPMIFRNSKANRISVNYDLSFNLYVNGIAAGHAVDKLKCRTRVCMVVAPLNENMYLYTPEDQTYSGQPTSVEQPWYYLGESECFSKEITGSGSTKEVDIPIRISGNKVFENIGYDNKEYCVFFILRMDLSELINYMAFTTIRFYKSDLNVSYEARLNNKTISTIKSTSLFDTLIKRINGEQYDVVCDLSEFEKVAESDLITSNSGMKWNVQSYGLRQRGYGITGKIKTSLQSFLDYCYAVYNYQLAVDYDMQSDKYRVYLAHFDNMYDGQKQIAQLRGVNDVQMSMWRDVLYTQIEAGYEVSDEAINVDREFNCKFTFGTPNTEIEESTLQLISPYSASTRDFETELYLHYNDEDDDSNDNVYVIAAKFWKTNIDGREFYEIDRSIEVEEGSLFPDYEWNVKFSPKRMMLAHERELFSYFAFNIGSMIRFSLCDHNSALVAGGLKESSDIEILDNILFRPLVLSVSSKGDVDYIKAIESNRLGYISFKFRGREVRGFLAKDSGAVNIKPMKEQKSDYRLLLAANSEFMI